MFQLTKMVDLTKLANTVEVILETSSDAKRNPHLAETVEIKVTVNLANFVVPVVASNSRRLEASRLPLSRQTKTPKSDFGGFGEAIKYTFQDFRRIFSQVSRIRRPS